VTGLSRTQFAVVGITLVALFARFFALGARVAHQDEARVAYWAYRYMENGVHWYRPIVHGPFLAIVESHVFELFGANDFTMRAVVALLGGLFPLSALLFRGRLRDSETVGVALFLAFNPILLYYSRFYRNDLLLAGFMLAAFGFYVRAYDHRRPAFLYAGTAIFALAFTTKENALVYPVCWLGAAVLLWDRRLLLTRGDEGGGERGVLWTAYDRGRRIARGVVNWWPHFALAVVEFFAVVVFFYAPRGEAARAKPTLGQTLSDPTLLPALVGEATLGSWHAFVGRWGSGNDGSYLSAFKGLWATMNEGAVVLLALGIVGFVYDRYSRGGPRDVVAFTFFWGLFSILGHPVIVDHPFPWETIHAIVPLVVPAAVGLALFARLGLESVADGDAISATAVALILLVVVAQVGATAIDTSYANPQSPDNELAQYAQSSSDVKPLLADVGRIAQSNDGIDVLFYGNDPHFEGDEFNAANESSHLTPPAGGGWYERLPIAWYLEIYGVETDSVRRPDLVGQIVAGDDRPPVVVALGDSPTCSEEYDNATEFDHQMDGYERNDVHRFAQNSGCHVSSVVIYVEENATDEIAAESATA
jgi:uncharacterized protein (TIGR03663 family)